MPFVLILFVLMLFGGPLRRLVDLFNSGVTALAGGPGVGRFLTGYITPISYLGRKSGKTITLPIGYHRGDDITIRVMPEQKSWLRNFLGAGGSPSRCGPTRFRPGTSQTSPARAARHRPPRPGCTAVRRR
jgi:hypothetical protein